MASVTDFLKWNIGRGTNASNYERAVALYQDLLRIHQNDSDKSAFLDVDLQRLAFGHNVAFGEEKELRYKAALKSFVDAWADHETSAMALHAWARVLQQQQDLVQARQLALRARGAFPNSAGGRLCANLISEIESKSLQITTERVWNAPWSKIEINYKNITNVHFRVIAWNWDDFLSRWHNRPENLNDDERKALLAKRPALEWSTALSATTNYLPRTHEIPAPDKLSKGFYFVVASVDPTFGDQSNQVSCADLWVSDLALVLRPRQGEIEGFVLQANSGEALVNAEVDSWYLDNNGNRVAEPKRRTDENGFFSFPAKQRNYLVRVRHGDDQVASQQEVSAYRNEPPPVNEQTIFFTDRALYRPGQTIQYKGICVRVNSEADNYDLLPGRQVTVVFVDPNNKEIERQTRRCNDYGSFFGSFTAARDRLMGQMRIYSEAPQGI